MTNKGHDSRGIANIFVQKALDDGNQLTIMSLLKYVYFAHGWTLGNELGPLICHKVEAWKHGPVVPEVYQAFRPQGALIRDEAINPKTRKPYSVAPSVSETFIIDNVYESYSKSNAFALSRATHKPGTPWSKYYGKFFYTIHQDEIKEYYKGLVAQINDGAKSNAHS